MISSFLAGFPGGLIQADRLNQERQNQQTLETLRQLALQKSQQQDLGEGLAAKAARAYDPGQAPQAPPAAPLGGGPDQLLGGGGGMPQPQQLGGGLVSSLPAPGAVKGSWFGNSPGWQDPSDSGLQASGVPVAGHPGIALPSRATLGQQFDVTFPNGRQLTLPQTDIGPSQDPSKTGGVLRGVDINSPAAQMANYTPQNFPTNATFIVKAHNQLDNEVGQKGAGLIENGVPAPTVQASTDLAKRSGREIDPQQWGMAGLHQLMQVIDKVDPGAPEAVKWVALGQLNKLLAPEEKLRAQMYAKDHQQELALIMKDLQIGQAQAGLKERTRHDLVLERQAGERAAESETKGGTIVQSGDQFFRVPPKGEPVPLNLPAGTHKMGTGQTGNVSDLQAEWVAGYIQKIGSWPIGSGRNQALQNKVEQVLAARGVDPTAIAQAMGSFKADSTSLAAATKLADATASYEQTALKNLDLATEQIHKAAPTDFGPFINKWIETGETFAGDTTVPKSVASVITLANEYAKVMSGATGAAPATDSARREAFQVLNPYFSSGQWDEVGGLIRREMNNRMTSLFDNVDIIRSRMGRGGGAAKPEGGPAPASGYTGPNQPTPGTKEGGFIFKGGNPADPKSWAPDPAGGQ